MSSIKHFNICWCEHHDNIDGVKVKNYKFGDIFNTELLNVCSKQNFCLFLSATVDLSVLFLCMTQTRGPGLESRTDILRTNELLLSSPPANRRAALRLLWLRHLVCFLSRSYGNRRLGRGFVGDFQWRHVFALIGRAWTDMRAVQSEGRQKRGGKVGTLTSARRSSLWWRHCHVSNWFKHLMWNCPWPPSRDHVTEHMFDKFENYFLSF